MSQILGDTDNKRTLYEALTRYNYFPNQRASVGELPPSIDTRQFTPEVAEAVFELDRCIECGICVAGCGTKLIKEDFVGAVGLNRVARFECDPHDERTTDDFYELVGDDNGIFGCMTLLGCEDTCPKHLPLQNKIAYMRRKLATVKGS